MHETEKRNAEIDVIAADINGQAARALSLAEETIRSAHACKAIGRLDGLFSGDDEPSPEQELERRDSEVRHDREEQIAQAMATEAQNARCRSRTGASRPRNAQQPRGSGPRRQRALTIDQASVGS